MNVVSLIPNRLLQEHLNISSFSSDGIGISGGPEGLAESLGSVLMMGGRGPTNRNPPCGQGVKGRGEDEKQTKAKKLTWARLFPRSVPNFTAFQC